MEINEGMYARVINYADKTAIGKITELIDEQTYLLDTGNEDTSGQYVIEKNDKYSKDIIKLLEKGDILVDYNDDLYVVDYIDGYYVFTTAKINKTTIKTLVDYQIKKVLTKEQFESNAYKIEKEG